MSSRSADLIAQVVGAMKPDTAGADPKLQDRMAVVLRHLLSVVEETGLTEDELTAVCAFFDRISEAKEWRFLTHVFGIDTLVTESTHGGEDRRTVDNVEGPLHVAGAPLAASPARLMRADEAGERLVLTGRVLDAETDAPLPGAELDVWQSNATGAYAEDDPSQPAWNFRRRVTADAAGAYEIETIVPGCYEIGDLSGMACSDLLQKLGRHRMRPGHIHFKIAATGAAALTTLIYFEGDPWIDDDSIFSVRPDVTLKLIRCDDPRQIAERGLVAPFSKGTFDFLLEPAPAQVPQDA